MHPIGSLGRFAICMITVAPLSGCVVGRIADDLEATRSGVDRLAALEPALTATNTRLDKTNELLGAAVADLAVTRASLDAVIARLDRSNEHLAASVVSLDHLRPMMASLRNLDESLAALRKVIENIDKAIPLIDMTKGTLPADRALQRQQPQSPAPE